MRYSWQGRYINECNAVVLSCAAWIHTYYRPTILQFLCQYTRKKGIICFWKKGQTIEKTALYIEDRCGGKLFVLITVLLGFCGKNHTRLQMSRFANEFLIIKV